MSEDTLWSNCLQKIRDEVDEQTYMLWFLPLQAEESLDKLTLYAPNVHVKDHVVANYAGMIDSVLSAISTNHVLQITSGAPNTTPHKPSDEAAQFP